MYVYYAYIFTFNLWFFTYHFDLYSLYVCLAHAILITIWNIIPFPVFMAPLTLVIPGLSSLLLHHHFGLHYIGILPQQRRRVHPIDSLLFKVHKTQVNGGTCSRTDGRWDVRQSCLGASCLVLHLCHTIANFCFASPCMEVLVDYNFAALTFWMYTGRGSSGTGCIYPVQFNQGRLHGQGPHRAPSSFVFCWCRYASFCLPSRPNHSWNQWIFPTDTL